MIDMISKKLKELRKASGISVEQACEHLKKSGFDIAPKTMYSYESGHRIPNTDIFLDLCLYYGCSDVLYEFGYTDKKKEPAFSSEEVLIVTKYRKLSPEGKEMLCKMLDIEKGVIERLQNIS